ncbi:MAG: hypothetical protein R3B13_05395 [Polyangiaceae bacterium]
MVAPVRLACLAVGIFALAACTLDEEGGGGKFNPWGSAGGPAGNGGATSGGSGGAVSFGGQAGTPTSGGSGGAAAGPGSGGASGGAAGSGGTPTGGTTGSGGTPSGGATSTGGSPSGGVTGSGGAATGGTTGSGGATGGSGGATGGTGGVITTPPTCSSLYGSQTGVLQVCTPTATECRLQVDTDSNDGDPGQTCDKICANGGGKCLGMYNDSSPCNPNFNNNRGCSDTTTSTGVCFCTLGCTPSATCPSGQSCVNNVCN